MTLAQLTPSKGDLGHSPPSQNEDAMVQFVPAIGEAAKEEPL